MHNLKRQRGGSVYLLHELVQGSAERFGKNTALTAASTSITYAALADAVRQFGDAILNLSVDAG